MRLIYEENIEGFDFLELILTPAEYEKLEADDVVKEFGTGINYDRPLNVCLRIQEEEDDCHSSPKPR